ncbi:hypothetical protein ASPWEDRAFT_45587 [Aspergillus wentii DTO 134E9]|uniref:Uncharacterized protein n=1 Tax=Aspergillus wentii DTO 134E9 TaxID=1073089 RepID=A0A1L9R9S1_ASPWE|nr:uncharacterized protein ASPWEDRAFT_45587 [Aspergillus wentii DTO 134E9]OJJ31623.1 hypothetical protein ASPWEDRAFT_45587 [Aspergillus wentii DTO 134E9]
MTIMIYRHPISSGVLVLAHHCSETGAPQIQKTNIAFNLTAGSRHTAGMPSHHVAHKELSDPDCITKHQEDPRKLLDSRNASSVLVALGG